MIVHRWQAPLRPTLAQARMIFLAEDLSPTEDILSSENEYPEHRHPFDEVRMIIEGELSMNISGNRLLLRAGDKIVIPANTKHSQSVAEGQSCKTLVANRPF